MVSVLSLVVSAVVGAASVIIMFRQLRVMNRQMDLMRRQDDLLDRRAILSLEGEVVRQAQPQRRVGLRFNVRNSGTKGAPAFYWYLFVPRAFSTANLQEEGGFRGAGEEDEQIDGAVYRVFQAYARVPVYPLGPNLSLGVVWADNAEFGGRVTVPWLIAADDGIFPHGDDRRGQIQVEV